MSHGDETAGDPSFWSLLYGPTVKIDVGKGGEGDKRATFEVSKALLTGNSPVLAAMLEGNSVTACDLVTPEHSVPFEPCGHEQ